MKQSRSITWKPADIYPEVLRTHKYFNLILFHGYQKECTDKLKTKADINVNLTIANHAGLVTVKLHHLLDFGAELNLFVELRMEKWKHSMLIHSQSNQKARLLYIPARGLLTVWTKSLISLHSKHENCLDKQTPWARENTMFRACGRHF